MNLLLDTQVALWAITVWVDQGGLTRFDGWMDRVNTATDLLSLLFGESLPQEDHAS